MRGAGDDDQIRLKLACSATDTSWSLEISNIPTILSQSYNATLFNFDISFLAHILNQLFLANESSISQAPYRTMVLTICFQLFKKQTI